MSELIWLDCACCGTGFKGWQHYDRDEGYGICRGCEDLYGYHTEGEKEGSSEQANG